MRELSRLLVFFFTILLMGCAQRTDLEIEAYHVLVNASVGDPTRTLISDNSDERKATVLWNEQDQIGVVALASSSISQLNIANGAGTRVATFDGDVATSNALAESYFAFYPYQDEATVADGRLRLNLPTEQRNTSTGVDGAACGFMVASCAEKAVEELAFQFENLFSILRLSLTGSGEVLDRVLFTANSGEAVSGEFAVDMTTHVVEFADGGSSRTRLLSDLTLSDEPTVLYVVVPAIEYKTGYSVRVTTAEGRSMVRSVGRNGGRTLERGVIYNLPTLDFEATHSDLSLSGTANCYIVSSAGECCFDSGLMMGAKVELLWEDNEGVISEVALASDGYVEFTASEQRGNAVVVMRDGDDNVVGCWHIWATEQPAKQTFADGTVALDRNLGAMSPTDVGLFYQWGRRVPFTSTPSAVGEGTLADCDTRPDLFLTNWSTLEPSNALWGNATTTTYSKVQGTKAAGDPCPAGWRVAAPIFYREIMGSMTLVDGVYTVALDEGTAYFPQTNRLTTSGVLSDNTSVCFLWTNSNYISSVSSSLYGTYVQKSANNTSSFTGNGSRIFANKSYGMNVRCVAE